MRRNLALSLALMFFAGVILLGIRVEGDEYDQGKDLYSSKCQICHGVDGKGDGPAAASVTPQPADFTNPNFWQKNDNDKISNIIKHGHAMMPAFDLPPEQIKAIIDYLSHAFKK
jgi:mono/diheme cytochrome c family protein